MKKRTKNNVQMWEKNFCQQGQSMNKPSFHWEVEAQVGKKIGSKCAATFTDGYRGAFWLYFCASATDVETLQSANRILMKHFCQGVRLVRCNKQRLMWVW